jgi:hypothetical protein
MPNAPLDVVDRIARTAFIPGPVQVLGDTAELNNEILAQVFWFDLASLLPPKPEEPCLIVAHDDPGVRTAYEFSSMVQCFPSRVHAETPSI